MGIDKDQDSSEMDEILKKIRKTKEYENEIKERIKKTYKVTICINIIMFISLIAVIAHYLALIVYICGK